jgi:hypothetical protein
MLAGCGHFQRELSYDNQYGAPGRIGNGNARGRGVREPERIERRRTSRDGGQPSAQECKRKYSFAIQDLPQ